MNIKKIFTIALTGFTFVSYAQNVGIGISAPADKLHITDPTTPTSATIRVSGLGSTTTLTTGTAPYKVVVVDANGRMIRGNNTIGDAWYTTGNAGTTALSNFIGTTDAQPFIIKTGGSAATNERMRFMDTTILINTSTPLSGDVLSVFADGLVGTTSTMGTSAINGYSGNASGVGVFGQNVGDGIGVIGLNGSGNGIGIRGLASGATAFGGYFTNGNASGTGLVASGNNVGPTYFTAGSGIAGTSSNIGVAGFGTLAGSYGLYGNGTFGAVTFGDTASGAGTYGRGYFGIRGFGGDPTNGIGIQGTGNNLTATTYTTGAGGQFKGLNIGSMSFSTATVSTGVVGAGNNRIPTTLAGVGTGGSFAGTYVGLYTNSNTNPTGTQNSYGIIADAQSNATTTTTRYRAGGSFSTGTTLTSFSLVACYYNNTDQKIIGTGAVSTIVTAPDNSKRVMYAPEAPEVLFEDYGYGQLVNGQSKIVLDPIFTNNVTINDQHPLRVFIQLEGDCNGVFVTNKTENGFEVKELKGGQSNVSFTYKVVANRKNRTEGDDLGVSNFEDLRFPIAPELKKPISEDLKEEDEKSGSNLKRKTETLKVNTINVK